MEKIFNIIYLSVFFIIASKNIYASEIVLSTKNDISISNNDAARTIMVLIDYPKHFSGAIENYKPDALMNTLLTNLLSKSGPLLVSAPLLKEMLTIFKDITISYYNLQYGGSTFRYNDWKIKEVNDGFYLLLPNDFLLSINIFPEEIDFISNDENFTETEIKLGLKVNHLANSSFELLNNSLGFDIEKEKLSDLAIQAFYDAESDARPLFCSYKDCKINWTILLMGHGGRAKSIVGLPLQSFKDLLYILNRHIRTKLLVKISCFSAGINEELIYNRLGNEIYNFHIVTLATTDVTIQTYTQGDKFVRNRFEIYDFEKDFKNFVKETGKLNMDLIKAIEYLRPSVPGVGPRPEINNWGEIPRIRYKDTDKFIPVAPDEIKPIDDFIEKNKKTVTIDDNIFGLFISNDFPYIIEVSPSSKLKAIVPMKAGSKPIKIQQLAARHLNIDDILDWFMRVDKLFIRTIIYIDQIIAKDNKIFDHIVICNDLNTYFYNAYYYDGKDVYLYSRGRENGRPKIIDPQQIINRDDYYLLLEEAIGKLNEYPDIDFDAEWIIPTDEFDKEWNLIEDPIFKNSTHIGKINIAKNSNVTMSQITMALLFKKMAKGIFLFIDEITAYIDDKLITHKDVMLLKLDDHYLVKFKKDNKEHTVSSIPESVERYFVEYYFK